MSSGSEKRQRSDRVTIRFEPEEMAMLRAAADRAGLGVSSYARYAILKTPPPAGARRPQVDRAVLAQILGHLGKTGSNLNQIARALNAATDRSAAQSPHLHAELRQAISELVTMRGALLAALGRKSS